MLEFSNTPWIARAKCVFSDSLLGPLSYEAQRGMYLHPTFAVTPERLPLGVIDAWMWAREAKNEQGERPGISESVRWIEGYERIAERAQELTDTRLVYVADREGDMLALMQRAHTLNHAADWLIRAKHNRKLPDDSGKVWDRVAEIEVLGELQPKSCIPQPQKNHYPLSINGMIRLSTQ
jgi:hypothetical protein